MIKKILIIMLALAPTMGLSQGKNNLSFGVGMVSDMYSDKNFSSLVFAGAGYNMGLSYERQINEKMYLRGGFAMQTSELSHELFAQPISNYFTGLDLLLYRQIFIKNQHKLSLGAGLNGAFGLRTIGYYNLSDVLEIQSGWVLSPAYQYDSGAFALRFSAVVPVLSVVLTQAHVADGQHDFHFASLHNYFSLLTTSSVYFRIAPAQYVGMDYSWHFKNNEVVKSIHKASNAVRVSYMFIF